MTSMIDEKKIIQVPNDENEEISIDNESSQHKRKIIFVNKKEIIVKEKSLTGKEILERADYDTKKFDLFLILGQSSEKIKLDKSVLIKDKMRFNAILKDVPYG